MAISKTKIKLYKTEIEEEIKKVKRKQREAKKDECWDTLKLLYLVEARVNGKLYACNHILNNCSEEEE